VVTRNKARLVAQGFTQIKGLDFGETYANIARLESIRILLAFATHHDFKLYQMDVKSAFVNGPISELVYVEQLSHPIYKEHKSSNHICARIKSRIYTTDYQDIRTHVTNKSV
jgi:hypothetical protein